MQQADRESTRIYRPDIDGIRAIAVVSVVLYHADLRLTPAGFLGVDIFFVISGYLIGGHIYSELLSNKFSFLSFYRRRAKRILPAFYVLIAFTIVAAMLLLSPLEATDFGRSAFAATLSASNVYFARHTDYFAPDNRLVPLLMTWSLGVEEQFYLCIPVLMVMLARTRRRLLLPVVVAISALSFLIACYELKSNPVQAFYGLPARAWELGVGVVLAIVERNRGRGVLSHAWARWISPVGLAAMLLPIVLVDAKASFPGIIVLPAVLGTAVILATPASWLNRRLLSLEPLVFVGKVSYSFYLWHWPIFAFLRIISGDRLRPVVLLAAIAVSFGMAIASYFFIEQPFRRSTTSALPLLVRYALVALVFLAASAVIWGSHGVPRRYPQLAGLDRAMTALQTTPCLVGKGQDEPNLSSQCSDISGDGPAVAVWGDSHAVALSPELRSMAHAAGYSFALFTKSSCRPMDEAGLKGDSTAIDPGPCAAFNRSAVDHIDADQRIRIVIITNHWRRMYGPGETDEALAAEASHPGPGTVPDELVRLHMRFLQDAIRSFEAEGKQVFVLGDTPEFSFDPLVLDRTRSTPMRRTLAGWLGVNDYEGHTFPLGASRDVKVSALLRDLVASVPGTTLVDLRHRLCDDAGRCAYRMGDQHFYLDSNHVSPTGAQFVLKGFELPPAAAVASQK